MKLSTREDVRAARDQVYDAISDFDRIEKILSARGVQISTARNGVAVVGDRWKADFQWRGRNLKTDAELTRLDPGKGYSVVSLTGGVQCTVDVDLLELSETQTRIFASLDFRPTTLTSRILLQSLKLAKPRLTERFRGRVAKFAAGIAQDEG